MRNGGKKQIKNREERVLYALKRGKKTENPTEKRKGVKKQRRNREERVLYALKVWTMTNLPKQCRCERELRKRKSVKKKN